MATSEGLPKEFGRYRVQKLLAEGGMGSVYLVLNTELQREEALKVPRFEAGDDAEVRERFLREARSAAGLDHPNLCPVYDVGVRDGVCYLTMRYLKGKLLTDYAGTAQPPRKAVEIVTKLAQALAAAHAKGITHRDLKPANVMMCPGVGPVVMDFGLAKQTQQQGRNLTRMGTIMGTPAYMPPEQVKGDLTKLGPTSDVYSLGVILFELLTGRLPFEGGTDAEIYGKILYTEPPTPSALRPGLPQTLDMICAQAMAKVPADRFRSMKDLAAALIEYLKAAPPTEGAGALTPTKDGPADIFQAQTVVPARATPPLRRSQIMSAETQIGGAPAPRFAGNPKSKNQVRAALPRTVVAAGGSSFNALNADEAAPRYRRSGGWMGPALALVLSLAVLFFGMALAWPYLRSSFQQPDSSVAQRDPARPDVKPSPVVDTPKPSVVDTPMPPAIPIAPKDKDPKPVVAPPPPQPPEPPRGPVPFPRRALVISVQNYLYANPVHAGMPIPGARNIPNFLEALNRGLHIPLNEMAQLSDGAPRFARPPMKAVIQKTLTDFLDSSRAQDRAMVFFIGHSVTIGDEMYLAPIEGELDNAETLIPLKWVYEQMARCKARQKVLVMDVNRLNPAYGLERPNGGAMDPKADAALKAPPDGVQVWTACLADQQSYELDDMGVFLDKLYTAIAPMAGEKGLEGKIQRPDDPLPLEALCDLVNASMKAELAPLKLEQQSRLSGTEAKDGAPFDRNEEPAPAIALAPAPTGSSAKDIQSVLDEVGTPSIKSSSEDSGIQFEVLPPFAPEKLAEYPAGGDDSDLRKAVFKARAVMWALNTAKEPPMLTDEVAKVRKDVKVNLNVMKDGYRMPADGAKFKATVLMDEREVADMMQVCEDAQASLKTADVVAAREKETKRWQANYDFTLARLDAQYAYLFEYQSMLGQMRKQLPDLAPGQTGWKLASQPTLKGDSAGKKLAKESTKLLEKVAKDNPGTPWEVLAKREKLTALGLEWQGSKGE